MHLQSEESIIKVYHHHLFPFILRGLMVTAASIPFYFVAYFFSGILDAGQMFAVFTVITAIFLAFLAYDQILFYLDRLIVTNRRILYMDWKSAFKNDEHEAELSDIQDITTEEQGIFSKLSIFDFGTFTLETASTTKTIIFTDAPNPEGLKDFVYHLNIKPNRIEALNPFISSTDDSTRQTSEEATALARRQ